MTHSRPLVPYAFTWYTVDRPRDEVSEFGDMWIPDLDAPEEVWQYGLEGWARRG